jgi:hypothetical protein
MASARKFFRVIWRINSLLILPAAGTVILAIGTLLLEELAIRTPAKTAEDGIAVSGSNTKSDLVLAALPLFQERKSCEPNFSANNLGSSSAAETVQKREIFSS